MSPPAAGSPVVVPVTGPRPGSTRTEPATAWTLLGTVGWVFLIVGALDVGLVWYPPAFGNPGWEFGSVTAALNGMPLPVLGTALLLGSAMARGHRTAALVGVVAGLAFAVAVLLAAVLYGLTVPVAFTAVTDPLALQGLKKAVVRSVVQLVAYPAILVYLAARGARFIRSGT